MIFKLTPRNTSFIKSLRKKRYAKVHKWIDGDLSDKAELNKIGVRCLAHLM